MGGDVKRSLSSEAKRRQSTGALGAPFQNIDPDITNDVEVNLRRISTGSTWELSTNNNFNAENPETFRPQSAKEEPKVKKGKKWLKSKKQYTKRSQSMYTSRDKS